MVVEWTSAGCDCDAAVAAMLANYGSSVDESRSGLLPLCGLPLNPCGDPTEEDAGPAMDPSVEKENAGQTVGSNQNQDQKNSTAIGSPAGANNTTADAGAGTGAGAWEGYW